MDVRGRWQQEKSRYAHAAGDVGEAKPHPQGSRRLVNVADAHITKIIEDRPPSKQPKKKTSASTEAAFSCIYAIVAAYRKKLGERGKKGEIRTHAANLTDYKNRGSSHWRMHQGIARARRGLDYDRHVEPQFYRGRVRYMAFEAALPSCADGYTAMPEWAINWAHNRAEPGFDEKAFSFAVLARKSPKPQLRNNLAHRLGVRDRRTQERMARQAKEAGLIELIQGARNVWLVGRPGTDFTEALEALQASSYKNQTAKNYAAKKPPKHSGRTEGTPGEATASSSDRTSGTQNDNSTFTRFGPEPRTKPSKKPKGGEARYLRLTRPDSPLKDEELHRGLEDRAIRRSAGFPLSRPHPS